MNRRRFFANLAGIFVAASAPTIFVPKLIETRWKPIAFPVNLQVEPVKNIGTMQEAFAAYIGPTIKSILDKHNGFNLIYDDISFAPDYRPSIPMDLYYGPMPRKK